MKKTIKPNNSVNRTAAPYTYRPATEADLLAICVLGQAVNALHFQAKPEIFAPPSEPIFDIEHWRSAMFSPNSVGFVAQYEAKPVAFVNAFVVNENHQLLQPLRFVRVGSVCVAQEFRGQGIGRTLMLMVERWAGEQKASDVRLNVWEFNDPARKLYEELGYELRSLFLGKCIAKNEV